MNKIKDFLYDHNDLVVVLVILLVAGLVISTRVTRILEYPSVLAAEAGEAKTAAEKITKEVTQEETGENTEKTDVIETIDDITAPEEIVSDTGSGTMKSLEERVEETEKAEQEAEAAKGKPVEGEIVTFVISSGQYNSWTPLAKDLEAAGIIDSWQNFMDAVYTRSNKGTLGNFYTKTYEIPALSDYNTIIDIINKN